ncbi:MAG: tetratricopeptide repeat protein [Spirochaetes bacterium]|nr:tetratricopeptide repeat protein [Spirochaetota bacterium]
MVNIKKIFIVLIFISTGIFTILYSSNLKNWNEEKAKAEKLYNSGKYDEAIILFREIILSSRNEKLKIESYFWLAKAYIGINKLKQAEVNLENYLKKYKTTGLNYPEAVYQKGRLLFLQEQYQASIEQLNSFTEKYPKHKLISNAYYWIGECLYALGQFDDSAYFFNIVISKYLGSIKKEASTYKLRLIEHKKSELALQNLLKWSQEQYLSALNQFRIKEKTLQQALEKYKKSMDKGLSSIESEKYKKLESENQKLMEKINNLETQIKELKDNISDPDIANKMKQLELKEKLLNNKKETLKIFEDELRKKEKALE